MIEFLLLLLGSEDIATRDAASAALRAMGDAAVPALLRAWRSNDSEVRARAEELLLDAGSRVPASRLELTLAIEGRLGTLRIVNKSDLPVIICGRCLRIDGLTDSGRPTEFLRIERRGSLDLDVRGDPVTVRLVPAYRHDPARCAMPSGGLERSWRLALRGESWGRPVTVASASVILIRIFALRNADAAETASILRDLFDGRIEVTSDARTNSIIVRADSGSMITVEELIPKLDSDP